MFVRLAFDRVSLILCHWANAIIDFNIPVEGEYKIIKPQGNIHHCIGCFGCWIKTPGKCVIHDSYECTGVDMSKCTELILICQCYYGSVSPFVKTVQDRAISYIQRPCYDAQDGTWKRSESAG